jgi:hypothetical protein
MPLTISVTTLGELAHPGLCPRCFWVKLKSKKLPYQQFPGIFSSIDSYIKRVTHRHFELTGRPPAWFPDVGDVVALEKVPHYSKFTVADPKSGVTLRGEPDDVLRLGGGDYHIVDYKTSRLSTSARGMYPRYEAQLNAYAYIANRTFFSPVSGLSLIYLDPDTALEGELDVVARTRSEFLLGFTPKLQPVELQPDTYVEQLLALAGDIYNLDVPPPGRSECPDCSAVDALATLTQGDR